MVIVISSIFKAHLGHIKELLIYRLYSLLKLRDELLHVKFRVQCVHNCLNEHLDE